MNIIDLIKYLPIIVFTICSRLNSMTDAAWQNAFILGGIFAAIVVAIQFDKKVIFDRIMLGVNLFLSVGAIAFLGSFYSLLYFYGTYKGAALLMCTGLVGIATTLYTDVGFIGADVEGKAHLKRIYSYQLLVINGFFIMWALMTNCYDVLISVVVPFIALRTAYERFVKQLQHIKE